MADSRRNHLRLLGALDVLLTERNVTRAAARLNLSQSATSGTLAQLRELFDDPLLVRVGRDFALSARASEMLPLVREALAGVDRLFGASGAFVPRSLQRQFRVAVSDAAGQVVIPDLIRRLAELAPGATLKVIAADPEVPAKSLGSGALDLVIGHYEHVPPDLRAVTLYESRLVVVARKAHPTIRGRMTLRQFLQADHVVVFPHSAAVEAALRQAFEAGGQPFSMLSSVQQIALALAVVARTDAVALVSEPMARLHAKTWALRVLDVPRQMPLPKVRVQAIWHERNHHDPACAWLRGLLRS